MTNPVQIDRAGVVLTLTLNRPDKRNPLSAELVEALSRELAAVATDDSIRVVVLTGAGMAFSAGADLQALERMQEAGYDENLADSTRLAALFEAIYRHPKPIIARVNGHAIAGGCGLAAVCDLSVAVDGAKLGFSEVRIGFVPAIVSIFVLRKLREGAARELFLRGHIIDARRAADVGLINEVVAPDELDARVQELAHELSRETSPEAIALTKRLLADVPSMGLRAALDYAAELNARARATDDCRAGVRAFLRKEDPPWKRA